MHEVLSKSVRQNVGEDHQKIYLGLLQYFDASLNHGPVCICPYDQKSCVGHTTYIHFLYIQ